MNLDATVEAIIDGYIAETRRVLNVFKRGTKARREGRDAARQTMARQIAALSDIHGVDTMTASLARIMRRSETAAELCKRRSVRRQIPRLN